MKNFDKGEKRKVDTDLILLLQLLIMSLSLLLELLSQFFDLY